MASIDVVLPEEAAGAAYEIVKNELVLPFETWISKDKFREHDWSLKTRIITNGQNVAETIELAGSDKNSILIKGPGITPTKEQTQKVLTGLGDDRKPEDLSKLATGTPNGYMRGHWLVKGNLERYENPGIKDLIVQNLPSYENAGEVKFFYLEGGRMKDAQCIILEKDCEVRVEFKHKVVRQAEKLSKGSPVYFKLTKRSDVEDLCNKAIESKNEIMFMSKYTVRPELDGEKKKIYNDLREKHGLERKEGNQRDIVDAAFAYVLGNPSKDNISVLVPDPSYGPKIADVIKNVYMKGVKKPSKEYSVCRFSAGKSEYGGLNQTVKEDGFYQVFIGDKEYRINVNAGDMFEEMHYNYDDAVRYVKQVFNQAKIKNYDKVVFAFDDKDLYDAPVAKAVRDYALIEKKVEDEDFFLINPSKVAVKMFTAPLSGKVCYAYDNLWGDIVSDAMDLGASIASINSVILLADGRVWPEMGGAGTAPDLLIKAKEEGFLRYNPVPIIEALSVGIKEVAVNTDLNEDEKAKLSEFAEAMHNAYIEVLKEGVSTPDLVNKLTAKNKKGVDTASFVREVRLKMHELLGEKGIYNELKPKFNELMKEIR
ncbi:MAG: NADP-dependent isocitrate dehydrogenase [Alphaproteobacteria bacterium]|nr:NADP-dependent isocitrate dehydrogenase [Alphaproteobacteria bacterium]